MSSEEKQGPSEGSGRSGNGRARRRSSLMMAAVALPTVESSLEDFIARANTTLVDVDAWESEARAEKERHARDQSDAEESRLRQLESTVRADAARDRGLLERRITELETELRDSLAQRSALEARVASLGTPKAAATNEKQLQATLAAAEARARAAEDKARAAEERARLAAEQARTAAKAASANVSDADDLAPARAVPLVPVVSGFIGGLAAMFVIIKVFSPSAVPPTASAVSPTAVAPAAAPTAPAVSPTAVAPAAAPPAPVVVPLTVIDTVPPPPAAAGGGDTSNDSHAAPVPAPAAPVAPPPAAAPADNVATPPTPPPSTPKRTRPAATIGAPVAGPTTTAKPAAKPARPGNAAKAKPATGIVDPFDAPTPTPAAKPPKKKPAPSGGGIVDPFAS